MYVGGATALVVSALLPVIVRDGLSGFTKPSLELLSAPLVMTFWTLIGLRVAMAIPIEPKANWVFRLGEPTDRMAALDGMRGAMIVVGVLPAALFAFVTAITLWGVWAAAAHTAICSMMGWALVEVLMMGVRKMPFTCTYFPGNSRVGTLWPFYLTGFITFAYTTAAWEASFLYRPVSVLTSSRHTRRCDRVSHHPPPFRAAGPHRAAFSGGGSRGPVQGLRPQRRIRRAGSAQGAAGRLITRGASPLGLPYTRSRAPLRRRTPLAWLAHCVRSHVGKIVGIVRQLLVLRYGCGVDVRVARFCLSTIAATSLSSCFAS